MGLCGVFGAVGVGNCRQHLHIEFVGASPVHPPTLTVSAFPSELNAVPVQSPVHSQTFFVCVGSEGLRGGLWEFVGA